MLLCWELPSASIHYDIRVQGGSCNEDLMLLLHFILEFLTCAYKGHLRLFHPERWMYPAQEAHHRALHFVTSAVTAPLWNKLRGNRNLQHSCYSVAPTPTFTLYFQGSLLFFVCLFVLYCQTHSLMFFVYIVKFICVATWGQMWLQPGTRPTLHHKAHLGLNTKPTIHYNPTKHSKLHLLLPEQPNPSWHWHPSLAY